MHYEETEYGFEYGAAEVTRLISDAKKGWIILGLETPKHKGTQHIQIYVTKTGKVRILDVRGEWAPPSAPLSAVAVDPLASRLRLRPCDINGPSRMEMLREREEAANEIERQAELIRELQAAMMEAKTGFSLAYDAASKGLNDEVLLHCGAGEARLSKFDR